MDPSKQCVATSTRTGRRCARPRMPGATVCKAHGAATGQVKAAAQRRVQAAKALDLAGRLRLDVEFSRDGRKVLEDALVVAQSYVTALEAEGAPWPLRLAALERVASIAVACARIQDPASLDRQRASDAARAAHRRVSGAVVAVARRAVYAAAADGPQAALADLEADLAKITVPGG